MRALGVPLRGRDFSAADDESGPRVVIVNEAMARRDWPGADPIGKQLLVKSFSRTDKFTVIGVAGDIRSALDEPVRPTLYVSLWAASGWRPMNLVVRSDLAPAAQAAALREVVRRIDAAVPVHSIDTAAALREGSLAPRRFDTVLAGGLAALALVLASVGLFGVLSQLVQQRRREIGIRLALGARRRHVMRLVLGRSMALAGGGAAIGLLGAH